MKKLFRNFCIAALACLLALGSGSAVFPAFAETAEDAETWYMLFGQADGKYYRMNYNDEANRWEYNSTQPYANLTENTAHPGNAGDSIKAWRAPADGTVTLTIEADHESTDGDGVVLKYGKRENTGKNQYGEYASLHDDVHLFTSGQTVTLQDVAVKRGDMIFVSVNMNASDVSDSIRLVTQASFTKTAEGVDYGDGIGDSRNLDMTGFFSDKQGENGWFYAFGEVDKYVLMTYGNCNDGTRAWRGNYAYQQISFANMHPADRWKTLRVWVADCDGVVAVEGNVRKDSPYGDGVNAGIYKNGEPLWTVKIEGADNGLHEITGTENISVKAGDVIAYALDAGDHLNNSSDGTTFLCELYYRERTGEPTEEDLAGFLNTVEYEGDLLEAIDVSGTGGAQAEEGAGCGAGIGAAAGCSGVFVALAAVCAYRRKKV